MRVRSKLDKALITAIVLMAMNALGAVKQQFDASSIQHDLTDIRERVTRIETKLEVKSSSHEQQYGYLDSNE